MPVTTQPSSIIRPNILDIEASGLGRDGYPIEVGVVLGDGQSYCSLIAPVPEWHYWDPQAEAIHGISQALLARHGKPVRQVAEELNDLLYDLTLFSDGWVVDKPWLIKLFEKAGVDPRFTLSALESLLKESQMAIWECTKTQVIEDLALSRHRASADALIIQETFVRTRSVIVAKPSAHPIG